MRQGIKLLRESFGVGVDSPESLPEVEGLTHDHLIEISSGVYMKFKHAYVVGGADGQKVELLDPHGDSTGEDKHFYTKELMNKIQDLYKQIDHLTEELETSNH